jgi:phosphatidylglycerophosphatase A
LRSPADKVAIAIGTGLYSGCFPIFPGTAGSVPGIVLYLILIHLGGIGSQNILGWIVTLAAVFAAGTWSAHRCEIIFGRDNGRIVIDEIWGMLISLFLLPVTWKWILAAFLLFRFFDIVKPFPARQAERIGGGVAVMLDDGFAGLYTNLALHAVRALIG